MPWLRPHRTPRRDSRGLHRKVPACGPAVPVRRPSFPAPRPFWLARGHVRPALDRSVPDVGLAARPNDPPTTATRRARAVPVPAPPRPRSSLPSAKPATRLQSRAARRLSFRSPSSSACSCLVPFLHPCVFPIRCGLLGLFPLPQALVDHPDLEQNPLGPDALLQRFELRPSQLIGTVGNIQQHAFELLERVGHRPIAIAQRRLPVQPVLFHQVFCPLLRGGHIHHFLSRLWLRIHQLHQNHFRAPQVFANRNHQHALTHLVCVCHAFPGYRALARVLRGAREQNQRCYCPERNHSPRQEQSFPPFRLLLGKARCDLPPHSLAIVFSRFWHRERV